MAIQVTAVHLEGGYSHQHISELRWIDRSTNETKQSTRQQVVDFIEIHDGKVYVEQGGYRAYVYVRQSASGMKFLQTYADGKWQDNLLSLPRF